jgi:hypothetical protein
MHRIVGSFTVGGSERRLLIAKRLKSRARQQAVTKCRFSSAC